MRVLVVGSGGREHALCWAIGRSALCDELWCAPGNAGIASVARIAEVAADDVDGLVRLAQRQRIDFVVIGPEVALVNGLADRLAEHGIKAFGPSAAAAELEGSKVFMKDICARYGIPTAAYARFDEPDEAKEFIHRHGAPVVVKADGLAAGKGVFVCRNENEAHAAIDHIMIEAAFGDAGLQVVIEDFLEGEEASFFALVNGTRAVFFATAQDHKPAFDGDQGPNTGGMGAYSPAPIMTSERIDQVMRTIIEPTIVALAAEHRPYVGMLYAGLMITDKGPVLLEYNVRFGDPECQPVLMRLRSDLLATLLACVDGRFGELQRLGWEPDPALLVVLATHGYPGHYGKGSTIRGLDAATAEGAVVFHAGTRSDGDAILADGGRVLGIAARGATFQDAQALAYRAVDRINWPEGFCRRDIGWRAIAAAD
ncbi:MAG: phosphoribosylamine--glycine ligase [Rhodospirillales bacterium]